MTQTGLPSTIAIKVLSTRAGDSPSASAACIPMRSAAGSYSYSCTVKATFAWSSALVARVAFDIVAIPEGRL
jgi:hypothetical protein